MDRDEFKKRLEKQFRMQNRVLGGYIGEEISVIRLRKDKEKYWAPQLQIRTEKDEEDDKKTVIRGLFGPRPAVWTFFIFLYTLGGTLVIFFSLIWFVQLRLNIESSLIIWAWIGIAMVVGTYLAAKTGQIISKQHIATLRDFMEKVVTDELEDEFDE